MSAVAAFATFEAALRRALCDPRQVDNGWRARCPACAGILAFDAASNLRPVVMVCRDGCTPDAIVDALNLTLPEKVAILGRRRFEPVRRTLGIGGARWSAELAPAFPLAPRSKVPVKGTHGARPQPVRPAWEGR